MNVQLAVLADAANVAAGRKLNIMGIFDTIAERDFPAVHPSMVLAMRIRLDYGDGSKTHKLAICLMDVDNKVLMRAETPQEIGKLDPGQVAHVNHVLSFSHVAFGGPGQYSFRIYWDDKEKERVDLNITQIQESTP